VKLKDTAFTVKAEKAILFRVFLNSENRNGDTESLEELHRLAETAGAKVVHTIQQKRPSVDPFYYLGKGKVSELLQISTEKGANVLICDDNLSPAQVKNLEKFTQKKVIDRSELILDIFATRAKTFQAKLQVELALLEYTKPRLKRMWTHLSRIEGGIGTRGPGEKQLEVDNRIISKKIHDLKRKLREIEKRQKRVVTSREGFFTVSLVGYTNAGKSTLMNVLTGADALVEDKLFATLDTKTSISTFGNTKKILISDTVGFIQKLPHYLVSSFKATLEEARNADLLLHVVDTSSPLIHRQIESVNKVLRELGCENKPMLMVFNKIDAVADESIVPLLLKQYKDGVVISAVTQRGIPSLKRKIIEVLEKGFVEIELSCKQQNGKLISYLHENAHVLDTRSDNQHIILHLLIDDTLLYKLRKTHDNIQIKEKDTAKNL